jgi:multimeric flavodoxin WrbA
MGHFTAPQCINSLTLLLQADAELQGIRDAGGDASLFQVAETLPQDVLTKMHAPAKADVPVLDDPEQLEAFDGVLFGIPTRYGNFPAQFKTFWDKTGKQWAQGSFWGKYAGLYVTLYPSDPRRTSNQCRFISTGTLGGGQESTAIAAMSTLTHHGFIYVPLGYKTAFCKLFHFLMHCFTLTSISSALQPRGSPRWLPLGRGYLVRWRRIAPAQQARTRHCGCAGQGVLRGCGEGAPVTRWRRGEEDGAGG